MDPDERWNWLIIASSSRYQTPSINIVAMPAEEAEGRRDDMIIGSRRLEPHHHHARTVLLRTDITEKENGGNPINRQTGEMRHPKGMDGPRSIQFHS
jgi:hypothetical protein